MKYKDPECHNLYKVPNVSVLNRIKVEHVATDILPLVVVDEVYFSYDYEKHLLLINLATKVGLECYSKRIFDAFEKAVLDISKDIVLEKSDELKDLLSKKTSDINDKKATCLLRAKFPYPIIYEDGEEPEGTYNSYLDCEGERNEKFISQFEEVYHKAVMNSNEIGGICETFWTKDYVEGSLYIFLTHYPNNLGCGFFYRLESLLYDSGILEGLQEFTIFENAYRSRRKKL